MGEPVRDDARGGKLLLIRKFFPNLCREPWATGVFLGEILRRSRKEMPHRTLLRVWKQLCGRERDLTWAGPGLWKLGRKELRRFLEETGEGGTLLLDGDAVLLQLVAGVARAVVRKNDAVALHFVLNVKKSGR